MPRRHAFVSISHHATLRTEEILRWLAEIGGVCDCTINTKALKRVVKLSSDLW
jgi:hypothetical protein